VDGFDQHKAESKRDERAVILRRLLASNRDTLEALELVDRLFDACPRLVKCFWKEGASASGVAIPSERRHTAAIAGLKSHGNSGWMHATSPASIPLRIQMLDLIY
jgi:hypothetical protein